jgi:hypothetical protein
MSGNMGNDGGAFVKSTETLFWMVAVRPAERDNRFSHSFRKLINFLRLCSVKLYPILLKTG